MEPELAFRAEDPFEGARRIHVHRVMRRYPWIDEIVRRTGYWTDRSYKPFRFFVEGLDRIATSAFIKILIEDLEPILLEFTSTLPEDVFFFWILRPNPNLPPKYYSEDRMLVLHQPERLKSYLEDDEARDRIRSYFRQMLVERYRTEEGVVEADEKALPKFTADHLPSFDRQRLLDPEEILTLIQPGIPAEDVRSFLIHRVRRCGCHEAHGTMLKRLREINFPVDKGPLAGDFALLERAARFEKELFEGLAARSDVSFRLDGEKVILKKAEDGRMVCVLQGDKMEFTCPWSRLDVDRFIGLSKARLNAKSAWDRLGYCWFYLFRKHEERLDRELKGVEGMASEKEEIQALLIDYSRAVGGANLIDILTGREEDPGYKQLQILNRNLRGTFLHAAMAPAIERLLKRGR
jgi:hypothetical protein